MANELQVTKVEVAEISYPKAHDVTVTIRVLETTASAATKMVMDAIEQANDEVNDLDDELVKLAKSEMKKS